MKTKGLLFLLVFTLYLVTPVMVNLFDSGPTISMYFSLEDEEETDTTVSEVEKLSHEALPMSYGKLERLVKFKPNSISAMKWDPYYPDINLPPPEQANS